MSEVVRYHEFRNTGYNFPQRVAGINQQEVAAYRNGSTMSDRRLERRVNAGHIQLDNFKREADEKLREYDRAQIAQRYAIADRTATRVLSSVFGEGYTDHVSPGTIAVYRCAARLASGDGTRVSAFDMDGTLTEGAWINGQFVAGTGYMNSLIPGRPVADLIERETETHDKLDVLVHAYSRVLSDHADVLYEGGQQVKLRDGVDAFLRQQAAKGQGVEIISVNFRPFVDGVLSQLSERDTIGGISSISLDDYTSIAKAHKIAVSASQNPHGVLTYGGDARSDMPALAASDIVGWYYALEGDMFQRGLAAHGALYLPFRTVNDICKYEERIDRVAAAHFRNN